MTLWGTFLVVSIFMLPACDDPGETIDEDTGSEDTIDTGIVTADGIVYPGETWPTTSPDEQGLDEGRLEEAAAYAESLDSHCLLVSRGGRVVREWAFDGWDAHTSQNVFSVTKSVASVLVGIASDRGLLDIDDPASDYIAEWAGTDSEAVTIRHLLTNTSGREFDATTDYIQMALLENDKTQFAVDLSQEAEPGTVWIYNNSAVQTLERVLREATQTDVAEFAQSVLFDPLQMTAALSRDDAGNPLVFSDMTASCRDLARFGYLVLRDGVWKTDAVVSADYLDAATTPSTELNSAYGYLFWLNREGHWVDSGSLSDDPSSSDGRVMPGLPEHLIIAKGLQSQLVVIDKENDLVLTRIGGESDPLQAPLIGPATMTWEFTETLVGMVLDALDALDAS